MECSSRALHTFPPVPSPRAVNDTLAHFSHPYNNTRTEVTTLDHEVLDDTVELGALVTHTSFKRRTVLPDTGRQRAEILDSLGHGLSSYVLDIAHSLVCHYVNILHRKDPS